MPKLTDLAIKSLVSRDTPYSVHDGNGLYLLVHPNGARYWRLDFQLDGRRGTAALGVYMKKGGERGPVSLQQARAELARCRALLAQGIRPADEKALRAAEVRAKAESVRAQLRADRASRAEAARAKKERRSAEYWTVERVAEAWMREHMKGLAARTVSQTHQSMRDHVFPLLGAKPIRDVTSVDIINLVDKVLAAGKPETAKKVRRRLSAIWQFAVLHGHAATDVVAPTSRETTKRIGLARIARPTKHHAAVEPAQAPALMEAIRGYRGSPVTRAGLLLLAYTMVRTAELRGARWAEFDLDGAAPVWVIPGSRMKMKRRGERAAEDHVVPLSRQAVEVLKELRATGLDDVFVLPNSRKRGKVMSENAMLYALEELGYKGRQTGHGFRAIGTTILAEAGFEKAIIDTQLAHEKQDPIFAAYDRSRYLERRPRMMQCLADALDGAMVSNVVPMPAARAGAA